MKLTLSFFLCFGFLALTRMVDAHPFSPPSLQSVASSDAVYLVQVSSVNEHQEGPYMGKITFSIIEVLRGKARSSLILTEYEDADFKEKTECILVHNASGFKDCVGFAIAGDCEWLPIGVTGYGDKATAQWIGSLDKVREYLHQASPRP